MILTVQIIITVKCISAYRHNKVKLWIKILTKFIKQNFKVLFLIIRKQNSYVKKYFDSFFGADFILLKILKLDLKKNFQLDKLANFCGRQIFYMFQTN